jgi:drug/metabolite transporter (DMT)-like permease
MLFVNINLIMNTNWPIILIVITNLTFSLLGDICAKLWGIQNNSKWLYIGLALNIVTVLAWMMIVRYAGLAIPTTVVLILTIILNVTLGFIVFQEKINPGQWFGIGLGILSILLILEVFKK